MTYPGEADAGDGATQHVSHNAWIGVGRWEVGMEPWRVPMRHLENMILH